MTEVITKEKFLKEIEKIISNKNIADIESFAVLLSGNSNKKGGKHLTVINKGNLSDIMKLTANLIVSISENINKDIMTVTSDLAVLGVLMQKEKEQEEISKK